LESRAEDQNSRRIIDRINETHFPELFDPPAANADSALWSAILSLDELGIIKLERKSRRLNPHAPPWESTSLVFQPEAETMVRQWLDRPRVRPDQGAWLQALSEIVDQFADPSLVQDNPFPTLNRSPKDILSRLLLIPTLLKRVKMTTCQLSAELFWGRSNLLDDKEAWLSQLLALSEDAFMPSPLLVEVTFPVKACNGILIIQNLNSYIAALDGAWPTGNDLILVHGEGFKRCNTSLRQSEHIRFHINNRHSTAEALIRDFNQFWMHNSGKQNWPVYAITDMDWDGMRLFHYLKQQFPFLEPWKPGYKSMLDAVKNKNFYHAAEAGKTGQQPMESSGSEWMDQQVLPHLLDDKFVDQEIIQLNVKI